VKSNLDNSLFSLETCNRTVFSPKSQEICFSQIYTSLNLLVAAATENP